MSSGYVSHALKEQGDANIGVRKRAPLFAVSLGKLFKSVCPRERGNVEFERRLRHSQKTDNVKKNGFNSHAVQCADIKHFPNKARATKICHFLTKREESLLSSFEDQYSLFTRSES